MAVGLTRLVRKSQAAALTVPAPTSDTTCSVEPGILPARSCLPGWAADVEAVPPVCLRFAGPASIAFGHDATSLP